MTAQQRLRLAFDNGSLPPLAKIMMTFFYWLLGKISDAEASGFFQEAGFQFVPPTKTGSTILTSATTSYTIVGLITDYNKTVYPFADSGETTALETIYKAYQSGYLLDSEAASLEALPWD